LKHHAISCGECLKNPPYYDHTYAPYLYQAPLTRLISDFKHNGNLFAGKALSELFYEEIRNYYQQHHLELPTLVAPVPLHWRRQWKRGFNQAVVLSDDIVKNMKLTLVTQSRRTKATSAQKMLSRKERLKNLKDCFHIKASLSGKSVAIIDDVMTTGTTVNLFAQALKKAGAGQVTVWVLTRTPSENI
jgi:ComF family protein